MSKVHKISVAVMCLALVFAVVLGVATRNSYQYLDRDNGIVTKQIEYTQKRIDELTVDKTIKNLKKSDFSFVITVKSSENICESTKVTAVIDEIIKGEGEQVGNAIVIHEPNFFWQTKNSSENSYYYLNYVNNLMQVNKQYLVFVNKVEFSEAFQKTLEHTEYVVELEELLYAFPLNSSVTAISPEPMEVTYTEIKEFDYFCYSEADAVKLNEIKNKVLEYFLSEKTS